MVEQFFMGGMAPKGFSTELTKLVNSSEYFTYILKGGPGTGKSSLMKKVVDRFGEKEKVSCFYCSSDPDSLDAVLLQSSKVIIVDGTPPHIFEPAYPGINQKIIHLGQYWDEERLTCHREDIIRLIRINKSLLNAAAYYNKALGMVCSSSYQNAKEFLNRPLLEEEAGRFCDRLFQHRQTANEKPELPDRIIQDISGKNKPELPDREKQIIPGRGMQDIPDWGKQGIPGRGKQGIPGRGKQEIRQLSVMTKNGYMTLEDTLDHYSKVYVLNDNQFAASDLFLDLVAGRALACGCSVRISPCLLFDGLVREHLLIDEISTAFVTVNPLTNRINVKKEKGLDRVMKKDLSLFYDAKLMRPYEKLIRTNLSSIDHISGIARQLLEEAKLVHDEIEHYYISAMDFAALDSLCDEICADIRLHRFS